MNAQTADVLATLLYKHEYWGNRDELITYNGEKFFYASHADIQEETCLGIQVIKRAMKTLATEGLIKSKRQGLGKPNLYNVNRSSVESYIENHEDEYIAWRLKIRKENKLVAPINALIVENDHSGSINLTSQEVLKSPITKNKNTNNKITNNFTNRINADIKIELSVDDLEIRISDLQQANDQDRSKLSKELFNILCDISSKFKNFSPSDKDFELILAVADSPVECHFLASKILRNARAIIDNRKDCRFGNLFIGIEKMSDNVEMKYSN